MRPNISKKKTTPEPYKVYNLPGMRYITLNNGEFIQKNSANNVITSNEGSVVFLSSKATLKEIQDVINIS